MAFATFNNKENESCATDPDGIIDDMVKQQEHDRYANIDYTCSECGVDTSKTFGYCNCHLEEAIFQQTNDY